jgi:hypothetical protein
VRLRFGFDHEFSSNSLDNLLSQKKTAERFPGLDASKSLEIDLPNATLTRWQTSLSTTNRKTRFRTKTNPPRLIARHPAINADKKPLPRTLQWTTAPRPILKRSSTNKPSPEEEVAMGIQ